MQLRPPKQNALCTKDFFTISLQTEGKKAAYQYFRGWSVAWNGWGRVFAGGCIMRGR